MKKKRFFDVPCPDSPIYIHVTTKTISSLLISDWETWTILQSVQRITKGLIRLKGYRANLRFLHMQKSFFLMTRLICSIEELGKLSLNTISRNFAKHPLHHVTIASTKSVVFRRRCWYKKIYYLTLESRSHKMLVIHRYIII